MSEGTLRASFPYLPIALPPILPLGREMCHVQLRRSFERAPAFAPSWLAALKQRIIGRIGNDGTMTAGWIDA